MIFDRVASIQPTGVKIQRVFVLVWGSPGVHVRQLTVSIVFGERATATKFTSIIDKSKLAFSFVKRWGTNLDELVSLGTGDQKYGTTCPSERSKSRSKEGRSSNESRSCKGNTMVSAQRCSQIKHRTTKRGPTIAPTTTITYYKS